MLAQLPPVLDVDALALSTRAIERARKVVDGKNLLRLALARGHFGLSLNQTAAWATMAGLPHLSDHTPQTKTTDQLRYTRAILNAYGVEPIISAGILVGFTHPTEAPACHRGVAILG